MEHKNKPKISYHVIYGINENNRRYIYMVSLFIEDNREEIMAMEDIHYHPALRNPDSEILSLEEPFEFEEADDVCDEDLLYEYYIKLLW